MKVSPFDSAIGGGTLEQTLQLALNVGPLGVALRENPERMEAVANAVSDLLSKYVTPNGVLMPAAVWIVSAHNGDIRITSVPSKLTTVTVQLPIVRENQSA